MPLHKNTACELLSRILSSVNSDWLFVRSVHGVYKSYLMGGGVCANTKYHYPVAYFVSGFAH